jgi:hypothetical protein
MSYYPKYVRKTEIFSKENFPTDSLDKLKYFQHIFNTVLTF